MEVRDGFASPQWLLECPVCQSERWEFVPKAAKKKRTWPYYNASVDVTFESESHEQKYVKENKLTAY